MASSQSQDFWLEMTSEEFLESQKKQKRSKWGNVPVDRDGIRFSSQGESVWYADLERQQRLGFILHLMPHPRFTLCPRHVDNQGFYHRALSYVGDAIWLDTKSLEVIVGEFKGHETRSWRDKRKLFTEKYPWLRLRVDYM